MAESDSSERASLAGKGAAGGLAHLRYLQRDGTTREGEAGKDVVIARDYRTRGAARARGRACPSLPRPALGPRSGGGDDSPDRRRAADDDRPPLIASPDEERIVSRGAAFAGQLGVADRQLSAKR